jgi:hypothetical protein
MPEFEITGCHADHAGKASVTLRHVASGAVVAIHHVPFDHTPGASEEAQCDRIRRVAAEMGRAALATLEATAVAAQIAPAAGPGAAPNPDQVSDRP